MVKNSKARKPTNILKLFTEDVKPNIPTEAGTGSESLKDACEAPMSHPAKLINTKLEFNSSKKFSSLFTDNCGFLVVGLLGVKVSVILSKLKNQYVIFSEFIILMLGSW